MWGNHLSERVAAGVLTSPIYQFQYLFDNIHYLTPLTPLNSLSLTLSLVPTRAWYFGTEKRQLLPSSILDSIYSKRLTKYLMDRDKEWHVRASFPPKWQYYNMPLAVKLMGTFVDTTLSEKQINFR